MTAKKQAFYWHRQLDRIGELGWQLYVIRNLLKREEFDITIICSPLEKLPRMNKEVFKILTREMTVRYADTEQEVMDIYNQFQKVNGNCVMLNPNFDAVRRDFFKKCEYEQPEYRFYLTDEEIERGLQLRDKLDIPRDAKVITWHVREEGYLPELNYHSHRDADIGSYFDAINYLLGQGYYIVRLGDKSMKRLNNPPPQVIDAPFHPEYNQFFEPYFIQTSTFYLGVPSGPSVIAQCFGVPQLMTNTPHLPGHWGEEKDLFIFKKLFSHDLGRCLTYEDICTSRVVDLVWVDLYKSCNIEHIDNTPKEILLAVIEMDQRLNGTYPYMPQVDIANRRYKSIQKKAHIVRQQLVTKDHIPNIPLYSLYFSEAQVSLEYTKLNPDFLGHHYPDVEWGINPKIKNT